MVSGSDFKRNFCPGFSDVSEAVVNVLDRPQQYDKSAYYALVGLSGTTSRRWSFFGNPTTRIRVGSRLGPFATQ
jgi:hypothetical protein